MHKKLNVQRLDPDAKLPTVAHAGTDIGYDLYALENTVLRYGVVTKVRTGIAAQAESTEHLVFPNNEVGKRISPLGMLIRDRSSMAAKGIVTSGGVIDAGYTGEIVVLMTNNQDDWGHSISHETGERSGDNFSTSAPNGYHVKAGDKIAQMVPVPVLTGEVVEVTELRKSERGGNGFGSTGV
jgi:dUTP pyrophosphatase